MSTRSVYTNTSVIWSKNWYSNQQLVVLSLFKLNSSFEVDGECKVQKFIGNVVNLFAVLMLHITAD